MSMSLYNKNKHLFRSKVKSKIYVLAVISSGISAEIVQKVMPKQARIWRRILVQKLMPVLLLVILIIFFN